MVIKHVTNKGCATKVQIDMNSSLAQPVFMVQIADLFVQIPLPHNGQKFCREWPLQEGTVVRRNMTCKIKNVALFLESATSINILFKKNVKVH